MWPLHGSHGFYLLVALGCRFLMLVKCVWPGKIPFLARDTGFKALSSGYKEGREHSADQRGNQLSLLFPFCPLQTLSVPWCPVKWILPVFACPTVEAACPSGFPAQTVLALHSPHAPSAAGSEHREAEICRSQSECAPIGLHSQPSG